MDDQQTDNQVAGTPVKRSKVLRYALLAAPLVLFGALTAAFYAQLVSGRDASVLPSALIGKPTPEFVLPKLAGLKSSETPVPGFSTSDLKGKVTLVNIFASWCVPCRVEHPVLLKLAENDGIDIVGINYKDKPANALKFLNDLGNPYKRVGTDERGRAAIDWGFYGIPETFLVGPDGIIRHKIVGPIDQKKFQKLKQEMLKLL